MKRLRHLKQMLYAQYLSYNYNTEAVLFACLSSGWATATGRLLAPKMGNMPFPRTQQHATTQGVKSRLCNLRLLVWRSTNVINGKYKYGISIQKETQRSTLNLSGTERHTL